MMVVYLHTQLLVGAADSAPPDGSPFPTVGAGQSGKLAPVMMVFRPQKHLLVRVPDSGRHGGRPTPHTSVPHLVTPPS